jgi:hypothetical protein
VGWLAMTPPRGVPQWERRGNRMRCSAFGSYPSRAEVVHSIKVFLDCGPIPAISPKFLLPREATAGVMIQRPNGRTRDLFRRTDATDDLGIRYPKSFARLISHGVGGASMLRIARPMISGICGRTALPVDLVRSTQSEIPSSTPESAGSSGQ